MGSLEGVGAGRLEWAEGMGTRGGQRTQMAFKQGQNSGIKLPASQYSFLGSRAMNAQSSG